MGEWKNPERRGGAMSTLDVLADLAMRDGPEQCNNITGSTGVSVLS